MGATALPFNWPSDFDVPERRDADAFKTALVKIIDFSNPIVTTRKGKPSDKRTMLIATPNFVVTISPNRKAKTEESKTENASQKLDPM